MAALWAARNFRSPGDRSVIAGSVRDWKFLAILCAAMSRSSTAIWGAAGAYHVAAELSARGFIASLTWGNAPRTDVLAQHRDRPTLIHGIQVKTRRSGSFQLGEASEAVVPADANEWYVLVSLRAPGERPDF